MLPDDEVVFEAVRERVTAAEYRDEMPGRPGENLHGGGALERSPDGRLRRVYWRGEPGFRAGRDAGRIPPLPPLTPATPEQVGECEAAIGAPLPRLLRRCYLELGDGGFGPAYGLPPLVTPRPGHSGTLLGAYRAQRRWPLPWRPLAEVLLPVCDWGSGIQSFTDLRDPAGPMWALDATSVSQADCGAALFPQPMTLATWLLRWAGDDLPQPALLRDQRTGRWRPAVDADYESGWMQVA